MYDLKKYFSISCIIFFLLTGVVHADLDVFTPDQGGTGIGTVTSGDIGKVLQVSNNSPFTYTLGTGGGGNSFPTSTNPLMASYFVATSTTATSTGANGWNLTHGCFAINGTCISSGGGTPAGSSGQVQFNNSGSFGADSNFFWDNSNKFLGIGNGSPLFNLDVNGNIGNSAGTLGIYSRSGDGINISTEDNSADSGDISLYTNGSGSGDFNSGNIVLDTSVDGGAGLNGHVKLVPLGGNVGIDTHDQDPIYRLQLGTNTTSPNDPSGSSVTFDYNPSGGFPGNGYTHTYRIYAYKEVGLPYRIYSSNYLETSPATDDGLGNPYNVIVDSFSSSGADGYRILEDDDYNGYNFTAGYDVASAPLTDTGADFTASDTVTPKSIPPYAWVDNVGNSSFAGDMTVGGAINANTYNGFNLTDFVPYSGATSDVDLGTHSITALTYFGDGSNLTGTNPSQWGDTANGIYYVAGNVGIGPMTNRLSTLTVQSAGLVPVSGTTDVNNSVDVIGTGTSFISEFGQGDRLILSTGAEAFVTFIIDDTHITVDHAIGDGTTQTIHKHAASGSFIDSRGNLTAFVDSETATFYMWQSALIKSVLYLQGDFTMSDGARMIFGTGTGTNFGTSASQKMAFWNVAPISQPSNSTAINDVLSNTGLRASGGVSNFTTQVQGTSMTMNSTTATSTYSTGGLTVGTNQFVVQQTSGRIGMGTSSPYSKLSVAGQVVAQNYIATSTTATSSFAGPFTLDLGSNTAEGNTWFRVGSSTPNLFVSKVNGNVGISTSTPAYPFDVNGTILLEPTTAPILSPYFGIAWNDSATNQLGYSNGNTLLNGSHLYSATAPVTLNSTSPASAFSATKVGTTTIAANSLRVGQRFTLWGAGYYSTPLGNTSTVTITPSIASTTATNISTVTTGIFPASASNLPYDFRLNCTVQAIGTAGKLVCDGTFNYATALTGVSPTSNSLSTIGQITFDSTVKETLDVKGSWSAVTTQSAIVQESWIDF